MSEKRKISTDPYKGVRDFYPEDQQLQRFIFQTMRSFVEKCGYEEYHASILEPAELYRNKTSEEIVNEQTYTFTDRGDREVTLRPEMTPTVARMVSARRRELGFPLRWYSIPNVFRYERPQRGRLREHWQLNVDLFGSESPAADIEIIAMAYGLMHAFGATDNDFEIRVSSRVFLNNLANKYGLSDEQRRTLLGLLDRRAKISKDEFEGGLSELSIPLEELSPTDVPAEVSRILKPLRDTGFSNIKYDPSIVRGFDYYTGTVFEVFDTHPDNNRALFGGGRYDNLLAMFGGEKLPAVGFGMGDVTITDFLAVRGKIPHYASSTKVYVAVTSSDLALEAQTLAGELRRAGINTAIDFGDKKLGDQLKVADKHKIPYVIVMGADEIASGTLPVRNMTSREETKVPRADLPSFFADKK